jgi:hypothetical protein
MRNPAGCTGPPRGSFFRPRSIRPDAFAADTTRTAGLGLRGRLLRGTSVAFPFAKGRDDMNNIIYLIGLVVVVVAILGFFGLR